MVTLGETREINETKVKIFKLVPNFPQREKVMSDSGQSGVDGEATELA